MVTITNNPPPTGQAADRTLMRVGGAMAVLGAGLAAAGNVLHPRSTSYYNDPVAWLDHNTESSIWFGSHVLILVGTMVLVGAFVALARSLSGTILYYTIFNLLYVSMMTLFGLAPIFYGSAMLVSRTFARWFGWVGVVVGSSVVASALLSLVDVNRKVLDAKVWPVTSSLVVFWFLGAGLVLWRRAAATPTPSASSDELGGNASASSRSLDVEGALV